MVVLEQDRPISAITTKTEHNFQVVFTTPEANPTYYSVIDANFQAGDSPTVLDINGYFGYNARRGYIHVFGTGDIDVNISSDGSVYGQDITLFKDDIFQIEGMLINKIKLTHTGVDSAYRIVLV